MMTGGEAKEVVRRLADAWVELARGLVPGSPVAKEVVAEARKFIAWRAQWERNDLSNMLPGLHREVQAEVERYRRMHKRVTQPDAPAPSPAAPSPEELDVLTDPLPDVVPEDIRVRVEAPSFALPVLALGALWLLSTKGRK